MTKEEGIKLLSTAPKDDKPSRLNPSLTRQQGFDIVEKYLLGLPEGAVLPHLMEKRVHQIARDQKMPRY